MAEITDYIDLTITINDAAPTEPSFGTLLIAAHSATADAGMHELAATPSGIREFVNTLGGLATDVPYVMMQAAIAQTPHVDKILFYNAKSAKTSLYTCTPSTPLTVGKKISVTANGVTVQVPLTTTVDDDASAALVTALNPIAGVAAIDLTGTFTLAGDGVPLYLRGYLPKYLQVQVAQTSARTIATVLDEALDANPNFYGVLIDGEGDTDIAGAAAWAETNKRLLLVRTKDHDVLSGTGVLATLFTAAYHRTGLVFSTDDAGRVDAALHSRQLALDPGASDYQFKRLSGVVADDLTAGQLSALKAKNAIAYTATLGVAATDGGVAISGRPLAVTRNLDWFEARLKTNVYSVFLNNEIVLIDQKGIAKFEKALRQTLEEAERAGVVNTGWTVTSPVLSQLNATDVNNGVLGQFRFDATAGKGVRKVRIAGTFT